MKKDGSGYEALKTMAVLAAASIVFGLLFRFTPLFYLALLFLLMGVFATRLSLVVASWWLKFAGALGAINSRIILSVVFFVLLTPIAFVYRLTHGDFMGLKRRAGAKSYFVEREKTYSSEDLLNPW